MKKYIDKTQLQELLNQRRQSLGNDFNEAMYEAEYLEAGHVKLRGDELDTVIELVNHLEGIFLDAEPEPELPVWRERINRATFNNSVRTRLDTLAYEFKDAKANDDFEEMAKVKLREKELNYFADLMNQQFAISKE